MLEYKSYVAVMRVEVDDGCIAGHTIGMRDGVTFEGQTVAEAIQAFHDSVEDYLKWCEERKVEPDKPFSGKLVLRLTPDLHKRLSVEPAQADKSLNSLIVDTLAEKFPGTPGKPSPSTKALPAKGETKETSKPRARANSKP